MSTITAHGQPRGRRRVPAVPADASDDRGLGGVLGAAGRRRITEATYVVAGEERCGAHRGRGAGPGGGVVRLRPGPEGLRVGYGPGSGASLGTSLGASSVPDRLTTRTGAA